MNRREAGLAVLFLGDLATCVTFGDWAGAHCAQGNADAIDRFGLPLEPRDETPHLVEHAPPEE